MKFVIPTHKSKSTNLFFLLLPFTTRKDSCGSGDKTIVERLRLLDELEENEKSSIYNIIDMAVSKKRLKDTLSNALNTAI